MDEHGPERIEVEVDGETVEIDPSSIPYSEPETDEFTPEMQARLGASRELNSLRERFGQYDLVETRELQPPERYYGGLEIVEDHGMLADAGAVVHDETDRVLLIRHSEANGWGHPSGPYVGEESLTVTAESAVREQTGVECEVTGFRYVREKHIVRDDDSDVLPKAYPMVTVVFEALGRGEAVAGDNAEVHEARWFDEPPADTNPFTAELLG